MIRTRVGYAGGSKDKPTYRSLGDHTEAVQIEFDPTVISYRQLVDAFWAFHDPCRRSGSTQYRAVLWTHGAEQARLAQASKEALERASGRSVTTAILPAGTFWIAEDYHQKYSLRAREDLLAALLGVKASDEKAVRDSTIAARANGWVAGYGTPEEIAAEAAALKLGDAAREALQTALGKRSPVLCR